VDPKTAASSSRPSRPYETSFWESATGYSKTPPTTTTTPPASGAGGGGGGYNAHDSLVAPLQPIALQAPISPARDTTETDAETVIDDGGDDDDEEEDSDEDGPPRLPELPEMSSPGFMREMPLRSPDWGSGQPTPTSWEQRTVEGDGMPDGIIADWDAEGVADWLCSLGLGKYREALLG
jgi:hypothetical protein